MYKFFSGKRSRYKREISHEYALYELMEEINNLLTNHLCPCKRVLIYSGPVMQ